MSPPSQERSALSREALTSEVFDGLWTDEHGHTYQAFSMSGWGDNDTKVSLRWVPPTTKSVTLGELRSTHRREDRRDR